MIPFYSKRNQVYPVLRQGHPAVEKYFADMEDWSREISLYDTLGGKLSLPRILHSEPGLLVMEYVPYPTLLDVLEEQERTGFSPEPWYALSAWLRRCYWLCGRLPSEGNLRNFLWDAEGKQIVGLDLECYHSVPLELCGASIAAALLEYAPADTPVKCQAAALLARELQIPGPALSEARRQLAEYRQGKHMPPLSGIVLAGGASRRMGTSKAEMLLEGKSLLTWQVEKFQMLGIRDIMLSGKDCPELPGTRVIPDELPERGPLGGLYSCFRAAENSQCMVLSVDTPLIPCSALAKLCGTHRSGITLLRYAGKAEPLIGIYDTSLERTIFPLIKTRGVPVRALSYLTSPSYFDYTGPEEFLLNCNTPQQFSEALNIAQSHVHLRGRPGLYPPGRWAAGAVSAEDPCAQS